MMFKLMSHLDFVSHVHIDESDVSKLSLEQALPCPFVA